MACVLAFQDTTFLGFLPPSSLVTHSQPHFPPFPSFFRSPRTYTSVLMCLCLLFDRIQSLRLNSIGQNPRPHITVSDLFSPLDRSRVCSKINQLKIRPSQFMAYSLTAIHFTQSKNKDFQSQRRRVGMTTPAVLNEGITQRHHISDILQIR